jgi:hypothetical protein
MNFSDAKIGQILRVKSTYLGGLEPRSMQNNIHGATGTVAALDEPSWIGLLFCGLKDGHNLNTKDRMRTDGWWIDARHLEPVEAALARVAPQNDSLFPTDAKARKEIPLASGVLDYFPSALIEVAKVSFEGNKQHNPGQPLHWARGKSTDQADTITRHFMERGKFDEDGVRHSAKLAWRALALLQLELEAAGAPLARGAKL